MTKTEAIALFGRRPIDLARAVGQSRQLINTWPEKLQARHLDMVAAALWRRGQGLPPAKDDEPTKAAA